MRKLELVVLLFAVASFIAVGLAIILSIFKINMGVSLFVAFWVVCWITLIGLVLVGK